MDHFQIATAEFEYPQDDPAADDAAARSEAERVLAASDALQILRGLIFAGDGAGKLASAEKIATRWAALCVAIGAEERTPLQVAAELRVSGRGLERMAAIYKMKLRPRAA